MSGGDPVEEYLDQLYAKLHVAPREGRRILAEAEDHLREAVAGGLAAGLTHREAQEQAISAFGPVSAVVRAHEARRGRPAVAVLLGDLTMSGWLLLLVGLIAVGASGLVAAIMNAALGPRFVAGNPDASGLSAAACHGYLALWPAAHSCAQAVMLEISSDAVSLRGAGGIAGLILLAGYLLARRWHPRTVLPDAFVPTVAVSLFGAAGAVLAWLTIHHRLGVLGAAPGTGLQLSGAIVALVAAAASAWPLQRALLRKARRSGT